jgi:mannosyltransferase OCH1-like enzyme
MIWGTAGTSHERASESTVVLCNDTTSRLKTAAATLPAQDTKFESKIPKIIHQVWMTEALPPWINALNSTCRDLNPGWKFRLWRYQDAVRANFTHLQKMNSSPTLAMQSDMMRLKILYRYGGIYVDTDFICLQPFANLLATFPDAALLVANEIQTDKYISNSFIATVPKHPVIQRAYEEISSINVNGIPNRASGPVYWGKHVFPFLRQSAECGLCGLCGSRAF